MGRPLTKYRGSNPVERVTGATMVCDSNHAQVHAGNAFHHSEKIALGNGGTSIHTLDVLPVCMFICKTLERCSRKRGN